MTILTIPQLELLIFLKSSIIPEWVLKSSGFGYGYGVLVGSEYGEGYGNGFVDEYGQVSVDGSGRGRRARN